MFLPVRANLNYTLCNEGPCTTRVVRPNEVVVEGHVARQVASKEPFGLQFSEDGIKLGGP